MDSYHVVPDPNGWAVVRARAERASAVCGTQAQAIEIGRQLAMNAETELRIHGRDGRIRDSDSYGRDPDPPHDRRH